MATPQETLDPNSQLYQQNPLYVRPGESADQYKLRVGVDSTGQPISQNTGVGVQAAPTNTTGSATPDFTPVDLQIPDTVPEDFFTTAMKDYTTGSDVQSKLLQNIQEYQKQIADLQQPNVDITEISKQVADIQTQQEQYALQTQKSILAEEGTGSIANIVQGKQSKLARNASIYAQELGLKESNLLRRLNIAQSAQDQKLKLAEIGLNFAQGNFDNAVKIQDRAMDRIIQMQQINQQNKDRIEARTNQLADNARSTLSMILGQLAGTDPSKLSPAVVTQLTNLSQQVGGGLSFDLVKSALQQQYDEAQVTDVTKTSWQTVDGRRRLYNDITGEVVLDAGDAGVNGGGGDTQEVDYAVEQYDPTLRAALDSGASPEEAVMAAAGVAAATGEKLSPQQRAALLTQAKAIHKNKQSSATGGTPGSATTKSGNGLPTLASSTANSTPATVSGGFFSSLFGN